MRTRRGFFQALAGGAAIVCAAQQGRAAPAKAPKKKVSKAKAKYQDHPQDIRACATCNLYLPPDQCKAVVGQVSPDGWCELFDLAD